MSVNGVLCTTSTTARARPTVWLDALATVLATLFVLGLYQTANLWLAHHPKLIELRNAP